MRSSGGEGGHRIDETLARGADQERQAEASELREPCKTSDALFRRLAEADARDRARCSRVQCRRAPRSRASGQRKRSRRRRYRSQDRPRRDCASRSPARRCLATSGAMSGSRCRPQTSLTIAAPWSIAQAAIEALMVSIDTGRPSLTTAGTTGARRAFSSIRRYRNRIAIGARRLGSDIEDVGTLPAISAAWAIATAGSRNRPPSEKESGVTLSTPMTSGRPNENSAERADVLVLAWFRPLYRGYGRFPCRSLCAVGGGLSSRRTGR